MLSPGESSEILVQAVLEQSRRLGLVPVYRVGTVFADTSVNGRAMVTLDNDTVPTPCFNYAGAMGAGQRALVMFIKPHGAYVIGRVAIDVLPNRQIFTDTVTPGTWTKPLGMIYADVEVQAGGGGGGGANITIASQWSFGDGGGGGEYCRARLLSSQMADTVTVTVGAGGTVSAGGVGNTGGTSSFGALVTAIGGGGGSTRPATTTLNYSSNTQTRVGGTGGVGGDVSVAGSPGSYGLAIGSPATAIRAGDGGSAFLGGGTVESLGTDGKTGDNYGGGGSGAANAASQGTARSGGAGGPGIVIVTSYFS